MSKRVSFFIDSLGGGGAERVLSVLSRELAARGWDVDIVMLYRRPIAYSLPDSVRLYYAEEMEVTGLYGRITRKVFEIWNRIRFRVYIPALRRIGYKDYAKANETSWHFYATYAIPYREYLKREKPVAALGFLIRSNISMLMAAKGTGIPSVFCERNNPVRPDIVRHLIKLRDRLYPCCKAAVFQTEEEQSYYTRLHCPTSVIPNPLKEQLPERFSGKRRNVVVNFCRLNKQKNIPLLIDAFNLLLNDHPDYTLHIYGEGEERKFLEKYISEKGLQRSVFLNDFVSDIHNRILDAAMFVSASDYEGLSNSMLEAMAIGLPCVCTDCDGGGAKMIIKDHENGILVQKGNVKAVYEGMREIVEDFALAEKLSRNAVEIRNTLSPAQITDKWEKIIEGV